MVVVTEVLIELVCVLVPEVVRDVVVCEVLGVVVVVGDELGVVLVVPELVAVVVRVVVPG